MNAIRFLLAASLLLFACEEDPNPKVEARVEPVPGQIVILNSCGIPGVAQEASVILRARGFDILSARSDPQWANYEETIVAIRNPHWIGYSRLKSALDTENFIVLQDPLSGDISATVFLGRDYKKVLRRGSQ